METRRVLIVDDDDHIRRLLERMLGPSDYEIESVASGQAALDCVHVFHPHLILLDLMMPDMSGVEVCHQLRAQPAAHPFSIIILSAKDSQEERRLAFEAGVDDYITKPFHVASLMRKIDHILRAPIGKNLVS